MPVVTLENGLKVNFSSAPTSGDIDNVIQQVHEESSHNSFLQNLVQKFFPPTRTYYSTQSNSQNQPETYKINGRNVSLNDSDINELNNVLFAEVSNRDPQKQKLEANTIINTVLNRVQANQSKGNNLSASDILHQPNQYQGYMPNGITKPDGSTTTSQYQLAASGEFDPLSQQKFDTIKGVTDTLKTGEFPDTTQGAFYYSHDPKTSEITYDNTKPLFAKPQP